MADHDEYTGTLVAAARTKPGGRTVEPGGPPNAILLDDESGWLADADIATEMARLTELHDRQRLNVNASSATTRPPSQLLALFRDR